MAQVKALIGNIKGQPGKDGKDGNVNAYSESETVIGTWNGLTLYRKVIYSPIPSSSNGEAVLAEFSTGSTIAAIKDITGTFTYAGNRHTFPAIVMDNSGKCARVFFVEDTKKLRIANTAPVFNSCVAEIVVEYIK